MTENINIGAMRDSEEYLDFISKFAPRKGSDDCFTPPKMYDAVLNWVCKRYGVERAAAERANAVVWPLSEAEMAMIRSIGEGHGAH